MDEKESRLNMESAAKSYDKVVAASQLDKERKYWLNKFSGEWIKSSFPYDFKRIAGEHGRRLESLPFQFTGEIFAGLMKLRNESDRRLFVILAAGLVVLLHRYTSNEDIILGAPTLKQEIEAEFINTVLILRNSLKQGMTFKQLLLQVRQAITEATENQNYPVEQLVAQLNITFSREDGFPLFDVALLVKNIHDKRYIEHMNPNILFSFSRTGESVEGAVEYNALLYSKEAVEGMIRHFTLVLKEVLSNVDLELGAIDILSEEEKNRLLFYFNDTEREFSGPRSIRQLFEEQAGRTPDGIAVVCMSHAITYRELNHKSNRLAYSLREKGVQPDTIVGIMLKRSVEMVVSILGILKAGGAYLPIEPASPPEKITYILQDSNVRVLLSEVTEVNSVVGNRLACSAAEDHLHLSPALAASVAYVIYTSGTTGQPKGVLVEQRNAVNTLVCRKEEYQMEPGNVSLQLFSFAFDGFVTSLFTPLFSGAKTILLSDEGVANMAEIKDAIFRHGVTHLIAVPSLFGVIIENLNKEEALSLRVVTLAGDKLPPAILETSRKKNPDIEIANEYGVTEAAVMSTIFRHQEGDRQIKIGYPIWNTRIYIMDRFNRLQPVGVPGELCIAGAGVTRGYLNKPELTAEKFLSVSNRSYRSYRSYISKTIYKTGDLARWLVDGCIQLLGRMDYQVKIRGFRIELGEIESQLQRHDKIKQVVVMAKEEDEGDNRLYAYLLTDEKLNVSEVREYLSVSLPDYMIPSYFVELEQMPLTPTGKIDRKRLLEQAPYLKAGAGYIPPRNETERRLVETWKSLLNIERVGIQDNFFNIGGDSIKTISLLNVINREFDAALKAVDLYENETIEKIANKINKSIGAVSDDRVKQARRELEELKNRIIKDNRFSKDIEDIYPLSDMEKGMIFYSLRDSLNVVFHNQTVFQVRDKSFAEEILNRALMLLVEKHPILRSGYSMYDSEEPVHIVYKYEDIPIDIVHEDISHMERSAQEAYINGILKKDRETPFAFAGEKPLWRMRTAALDDEHICFIWVCHHALLDGWSIASLMTELNNTYLALKEDGSFVPRKLKSSYKEFVIEHMGQERKREAVEYWKRELVDYKRFEFPRMKKKPGGSSRTIRKGKNLGGQFLERIKKVAVEYDTSIKNLCFGAYIFMLSMLSYDNDITAGLVNTNRPVCEDGDKILGCFLNTVPVRLIFPANIKWKDVVDLVGEKLVELKNYDMLTLFEIVQAIGEQTKDENPIFDTIFNYMDFHVYDGLNRESRGGDDTGGGNAPLYVEDGGGTNTPFDLAVNTTLGNFSFSIYYLDSFASSELVEKCCGWFEAILDKFIHEPEGLARKEALIRQEEKQALLDTFNDTAAEYLMEKPLHKLFEEQAEKTPAHIAVNGIEQLQITYWELNKRSDRLAHLLRKKGVQPDTIVGIMLERSVEMIIGMLGILKAGGAYLPIDPGYPRERIDYMLTDSGTTILLSELSEVSGLSKEPTHLTHLTHPTHLCYVIFTSGTTGMPKGVMVEHRNVVNVLNWFGQVYRLQSGIHVMQATDYIFDPAVEQIFGTLIHGATLYVIGREQRADIDKLRQYIEEHQVHIVNFVPAMLRELLVNKPRLKSLRIVISGGEKLDDSLKDQIIGKGYALYNHYGPTETTIEVLAGECNEEPVTLGKPVSNIRVYILDKNDHLQSMGIPGELCISGAGLARGYLNNPELTTAKFLSVSYRTYRSYRTYISKKIYKTGDLARWLPDANIEFLGRIDRQVKIRGFRIELGEIEYQLVKHDKIKEAVVIELEDEDGGDNYLCAYFVCADEISLTAEELKEYLSVRLPGYMVPGHFVQMDRIPLTSTGKIDRKQLPRPVFSLGEEYTAPGNEVETKLAAIWEEVLGLKQDAHSLGIDDSFFALGGHSLKAILLVSKVHKAFNVKLPLEMLFKAPTIRQMARYIQEAREDRYVSIEPVENREYYGLSSAQKRMYFLQQMKPENTAYNMPLVLPLGKDVNKEKLEFILRDLIARHESLRTSFMMVNKEPVQRVHDHVEFEIEYFDLAAKALNSAVKSTKEREEENIIGHFVFPFALSQAPLIRSGLMRMPDHNHIWLVDIHHIVSDGVSHNVLWGDFIALYNGQRLGPLRLQYKDFSQWQNRLFARGEIKVQEDYWLELYADAVEIPRLQLPVDFKRPEFFTFEGANCGFTLGKTDAVKFKALGSAYAATLYMNILAALNTLFYKYTGQRDIIIGTVIAGRRHVDLNKIIGMFVNTLPMRNSPEGEKTYGTFLREVTANSVSAFENQGVQFEELVEKLQLERNTSRNPLSDVSMVVQDLGNIRAGEGVNLHSMSEDLAGASHKKKTAKFDMTFFVFENAEDIYIEIEYYTGIFKEETIRRMILHFKNVIKAVVKNPSIKLKAIDVLSPVERRQILYEFNDTAADYPKDKTIHELFDVQVERTPDHVAIVDVGAQHAVPLNGNQLTYRELHRKSNLLANVLREKGVQPDTIVGIMLERSIEMIIGILGILKAGGAYLPIEPDYPQERIDFMLADSNAGILLTERELLDIHKSTACRAPTFSPATCNLHLSLAYIIYTSGSTGKPRGVLTTHYNVTRVVRNTNYIHLTVQDRILQLSNYAFDGSVFDIYGALLNGAALILAPGEKAAAVDHLAEVIKKENITVFFVTTALFNLLVDEEQGIFANIKKVLFGGERVSVEHTRRALDYSGKNKIIHVYGPTETTVYATYYFVNEVAENISTVPIGSPLSNTTVYILDNYLNPVPIGVMGELYIGGYGTARGYLNNPVLTNEKFLRGSRGQFFQKEPPGRRRQKIYKTGDLGRWLSEGGIEFLGRIDFQVKIRGFRIELGEIEYQLIKHDEIKEAVVVDTARGDEDTGDKYLCAYIVSDREIEISGLNEYLSKYLPAYMIPSYFMQIEKIPLTANGKLDRKALPVPEIKASEAYAVPENEIEEKLVDIWAEVLGINKETIGIHDNFFERGGHSLKATIMVAVINKTFGVKVPLGEIFKGPTIHEIAELLMTLPGDKGTSTDKAGGMGTVIDPVERKEYYPLSSAQKRLYFLQQMDLERTAYNMSLVLPMGRDIDKSKLESTIKELIARHESLRTSFIRVKDEPVQVVHDHVEFEVEYYDLTTEELIGSSHRGIRSFDLSQAPLIRSGLIRMPDHNHIWMADIHHIVSDGTSHSILMEDFFALYNGHVLQPLRLHYKDFSGWQNYLFESGQIKAREEYWLDLFSDVGELPRLDVPLDDERPRVFTFAGDVYEFPLNREDADKFTTLASNNNGTLYMNILTALNILFYKYTGQTDIIIGSGIAGRPHIDLQRIIGMFINTLAMRNYPEGEKAYEFFLREVIANSVKAFENQDVQFEELVEKLKLKRDPSRNPLFDISMVVQNLMSEKPGEGSSSEHLPHTQPGNRTSKFDMTFFIVEHAEGVFIGIEFYTGIFKRETIQRLASHLKNVINAVIEAPSVKIKDIDIITGEERQQLLYEFNDTVNAYPDDKTIQELFEDQVERTPDASALVYKNEILTYNQLNREANTLAHYLYYKKNVGREDRIGILMDHPLYCAITIIGILKAGGVYVPLGTTLPLERVKYMIKDACIGMVISEKKYGRDLERLQGECDSIHSYLCMDTPYVDGWEALHLNIPSGSMAYIIYTSGTTGEPKGVEVEHRGVVNTLLCRKKEYVMDTGVVSLQLFSYGFDGFVTSFFTPLISGSKVVLPRKEEMGDIEKIRETVVKQGVTHFISVPPLYSAMVEFFTKQDFSTIKAVTLAGDKVVSSIVERTRVKSDTVEIVNEYGVTESSVMSTIYRHQEQDSTIKIGRPIWNTCLYILDAAQRPQPIGVFGELCISGEGLARGYLNHPELTSEKFLSISKKTYKTGDLARWLPDGNIEFSGRMDQQVKLRGFRIELAEIESCLLKHEFIREAVVTAREENGETYLCAYIVPTDEAVNMESVQADLAGFLPDYMIPGYFVQVEKVPLTHSGKVDRKKLPKPQIKTGETYTAPRNEIEAKLAAIWQEVLGLNGDVLHKSIGIDDSFFDLGGHSLKATILTSKIHKGLDVNVPLAEIFTRRTIRELARYIEQAAADKYASIENAEAKEYYALSSAQKRIYFLQQLDLTSTTYNMPFFLSLGKDIEKDRLGSTLKKLIAYHESLRTSFIKVKNEPVQVVQDHVEFEIEYFDLAAKTLYSAVKNAKEREEVKSIILYFIRPFALSQSPLVRSGLIRLPDNNHIWMVDMHHIISDGTSHMVLTGDFLSLYNGEELVPLRLHYKDFSQWQNRLFASGTIKAQEDYWLELYWDAGEIPRLELPTDFKRPGVFSFAGDNFIFKLEKENVLKFKELGSRNGGTLYMNILAALNTLFYKYTGQSDIIIGTGTAGRPHTDLQQIIGMFINTLAMRNYPKGEKTYEVFLREVIAHSVKAFENQDVQFEELVDRLDVERDPSRNPLFDISMVVQNLRKPGERDSKGESSGQVQVLPLADESLPTVDNATSKFDMTFFVHELGDEVYINIEYYTGIFERKTIQRLVSYFKNVINAVINQPAVKLKDIGIISEEEKKKVLNEFNNTAAEYPEDKTIHELFAEQAGRTPDHAALVYESEILTYRELERTANRLACYLQYEQGIHSANDNRVGIFVSHSLYLPAAVLGILKAGGAFVPLEPSLPEERIKYMINDAAIGVVISERRYIRALNRLQWECKGFYGYLCMDSFDIYGEDEVETSELMNEELWNHIGETAVNEITGGGWISSYTGEPLSKEEMDEYGENILKKLEPLLHEKMRVLEIGCASGISMYRIAAKVELYYGTDLSAVIIAKNRKRVQQEEYTNIRLSCLAAHEIDTLEESNFDLIIMNSVIQCFHGHNYLKKVIRKCIDLVGEKAYLFIGDIMDQEKKETLVRELLDFKYANRGKNYTTKTDFSAELFVSTGFWEDLEAELEVMEKIDFSDKIYTIENELSKFRYDVLITINKNDSAGKSKHRKKQKYQDDVRSLSNIGWERFNPGICMKPGNLAYIIYTSGSTGKPKGVMVGHRGISSLSAFHKSNFRINEMDRVAQFASSSFDASVWEIFMALLSGAALHVVRSEVIGNFKLFETYFKKNRITIVTLPPPYANHLDADAFGSLRLLFTGGSASTPGLVDKWKEKVEYVNAYGPTETTICSTCWHAKEGGERFNVVPIGKPLNNTYIYILDGNLNILPIGVPGELCIAGVGLARGYLNKPELTAEKFIRLHLTLNTKHFTLYRTGDLARWMPEGNIEFLGRVDQQVKLRGFRIELGEIESRLLTHDLIDEAVIIDRDGMDGDKYLCAYIVLREMFDLTELKDYLSRSLPDYMIPAYFIDIDKIPLTPSGKVDRKTLPVPGLTASGEYTAPGNEVEKKLAGIWQEILGVNIAIGIDDSFFELGGHSLKATTLTSRIHKELNVKVPLAEVFKSPTIRGLSEFIQKTQKTGYESIEPVEKKEYYPLSSAQKRMYFLQQLDVNSTGYNVPMILPWGKDIEIDQFESTIKKLIARHESLRTSFVIIDEEPVQRMYDHVEFEIEFFDLAAKALNSAVKSAKEREEEEKIIHQFSRVFDLSQAPLIRAGIFKSPEGYYLLMVDMHHIITDGTSQEVLKEDFINLYRSDPLEPLRIQYKDFSQWQNHLIDSGQIKAQEDYWLELYTDAREIPRLQLPTDDKRPEFFTFSGGHYGFMLAGEDAVGFKVLGSRYAATLYMNMLTALNTLFYKYTGQGDIVIGTGIGGRRHADLQRIIGMFVNTLVMRNYPRGEKTYESFLEEVIANSVSAFENQDVQFEELVDKLEVERDTSRNPLFDISMVVQDFKPAMTGEELSPHEHKQVNETAKFDMTFFIMEYDEGVYIDIEYYTGIFKEETIRRMALHLKNVIKTVASTPSIKLKDIDILSVEERRQILDEFNDTERRYPQEKTIHELFNEQVERTPDHAAIVNVGAQGTVPLPGDHISITYKELNKKSDRLAHHIRSRGVGPDTIVGIKVERSIEMIIGILGILKAGCSYLPIDPDSPEERIDYMLKDSEAKVLVTVSTLAKEVEKLRSWEVEKVFLKEVLETPETSSQPLNLSTSQLLSSSNLAYIIYTSGTTGRPKGTPVAHRSLVNLCYWHNRYYAVTEKDNATQYANVGFDASVWEIFPYLIKGAALHIIGEDIKLDIQRLGEYYKKHHVTISFLPTQLCQQFMEETGVIPSLRCLLTGGDKLNRFVERGYRLYNNYGPTENTVVTTSWLVEAYKENIPIGKPIDNSRVYILNKDNLQLQPLGVAGELCVAGDSLARGYLNKPELTAEKFRSVFYRSYRSYRSYISKKIYKTGDLARWLPDGNIEFLGRIDQQVKVRGFRIELAEIEYRLMQHDEIKEAVVVDRQDVDGGDKYLCAYIVLFNEVEAVELKEYLSANLPNYMIPAHFVPIESIPITLHGKVDRKKLPGPEIQAGVKYTPPGNDVEKKLVEIWSEVIGVPQPIGIDDNFFELGGHSLKAAILTAKVHEKLGVNVPLAELFKHQTIRTLAEILLELAAEDKKQLPVDDHLVLLRKGTDKANNMFFIHAGSGDVEVYVEFCNHLHPGFNYWGIRISAGWVENLAPQHRTIEALAQEYVQTIKNVQPHGPYRLGGWSIGGTIAFEMVRQLEQMGEKIDFFAMIDSSAPNITLTKTTRGSPLGMVDRFEENDMDVETIKNKVPGPIREAIPNIEQLDIGEIIYYWNVIRSLDYARNVYIPDGKISTEVHFFGASYTGGIGKDKYSMVKQWNDYTTGVINFYEVHGDHYSLFKKPHVVPFAEMFNKETGE